MALAEAIIDERYEHLRRLLAVHDIRLEKDIIKQLTGYSESYFPIVMWKLRKRQEKLIHLRRLCYAGIKLAIAQLDPAIEGNNESKYLRDLIYIDILGIDRRVVILYMPLGKEKEIVATLESFEGLLDFENAMQVPISPINNNEGNISVHECDEATGLVDPITLFFYSLLDKMPLAPLRKIIEAVKISLQPFLGDRASLTNIIHRRYIDLSKHGILGRVYLPRRLDKPLWIYVQLDRDCLNEFYSLISTNYICPEIYIGNNVHAVLELDDSTLSLLRNELRSCILTHTLPLDVVRKPLPAAIAISHASKASNTPSLSSSSKQL